MLDEMPETLQPGNDSGPRRATVGSLVKALRVLECFSSDQLELGVTQISQALGLHKSTVYNILSTFEQRGYVEQDRETRRYRLGLRILHLSNVVREGLGLRKVALPVMQRAKDIFQETVHLTIEQEGQVVYIESVQPADSSVARLAVGKRAHMHCTGVGKAILAFLPDQRVKEIIARHGLPRYTPNTTTSASELAEELEEIRLRGYAVDNMEHEWGIRCLAVPIRGERGTVGASISVSGPSERLPLEAISSKAQLLIALGVEVSRRLGWDGI